MVDIIILGILSISVLIGLSRGLISEMLAVAIWGVAIWASFKFGPQVGENFGHSISIPSARLALGYGICFVAILVIGAIIKAMVNRMLIRSGLSGPDRMLGMAFGFARGVLLVSLLVFLFGLTSITRESWWSGSALLPQFQSVAVWLGGQMPPSATHYLHSTSSLMNQLPSANSLSSGFSGLGLSGSKGGQFGANNGNTNNNGMSSMFDLRSLQGLTGGGGLQGLHGLPGFSGLPMVPGLMPAARAPAPASTAVTPMYIR